MKIKELKKELKKINKNWEVIDDAEEIYWNDYFTEYSIATNKGIDVRTKGRYKPVLVKNNNETIIIEWDYGRGNWIVHGGNCQGIIATPKRKSRAIHKAYMHIEY